MGKYADLYRKKYEEAKASGKWQLFITDPPMWMLVHFSLDQNMDPLKDDYEERLYKLREEDEEMFNIMVTAFDDFLKQMDKSLIVVDSTPDDAPQNWRRFDIYEKK
jgi:hypothetical protein